MVGICLFSSFFGLSLCATPLSSSLKTLFHFSDTLPSSSLCLLSLPGAGLLSFSYFFQSFLPSSFSISTIFLSHSSFPPRSPNSSSRFSPLTKGSVSLYYTPPLAQPPNRHTQLFLYAACLQEPPRMSNSLIRAPREEKATSISGRSSRRGSRSARLGTWLI